MRPAATLRLLLLTALAIVVGQAIYAFTRAHPEDLPWAPLDLTRPPGAFTVAKIAGLRGDFAQCRRLLDAAGARYTALPPRRDGANCGYGDGVRPRPAGLRYAPAGLGVACPVAAALAVWERETVQPAAERLLGARVVEIEHFGSYSCRRLYGRSAGDWSEHARAAAIDIAGFRLADGRRLTVARNWRSGGADGAFLHAARDGACEVFATTLSPDYNTAHRDHLHLDEARRGGIAWGVCR